MEAPPLSTERRRELADLRSRAYGPDADIERDADAMARLIELEELARSEGAEPPSEQVAAAVDPASSGRAAADPDRTGAPTTSVLREPVDGRAAADDGHPDALARRRWWRRIPLWGYIVGALVVGLAAGLALPSLSPPHPVATLQQVPVGEAPLDFGMYGVQSASPSRYQPFHDLEVWSTLTDQGSSCIVVTTEAGEWIAAGCAPAPLHPTADVTFYEGMRPVEGLDLPDGSVLRFVLRGDVMEVWIAETVQRA